MPDDPFASLSEPAPLRRAATINYEWGDQHFEVFCSACSIRTLIWPKTQEDLAALYGNANRGDQPRWPNRHDDCSHPGALCNGYRAWTDIPHGSSPNYKGSRDLPSKPADAAKPAAAGAH